MKHTKVKPAPQRRVLDAAGQPLPRRVVKPGGQLLAAEGEEVQLDTYWRRRLRAGDVVEVASEKPAKKREA